MTNDLFGLWLDLKAQEDAIKKKRHRLEDKIRDQLGFSDLAEGTSTYDLDGYIVKITGRHDRRIDAEGLKNVTFDIPEDLIKWKPTINLTAWRNADSRLIAAMSEVVTTSAGRPSFKITTKGEENE